MAGSTYSTVDGVELQYDSFAPEGDTEQGTVICIHGGGWISGDREDVHELAQWFAGRGYTAFCPEYRLAPLHTFPAPVEDCRSFVRHLRINCVDLGIDAHRLVAIGNSAGGYLATMLAVTDVTDGGVSSRIDAAADICGLTDLTHPTDQHPMVAWDFINQFVGVPFDGNEETWAKASPLLHVDAKSSPTIIFHGDADDIVWPSQSTRLHEALVACDVPAELHILKGEGHSFGYEAFVRILDDSDAFFRSVLA